MGLVNPITDLGSYKNYLHGIGKVPTAQLERCIACGLPAVWLYMKAIGLEPVFFDLLNKVKTRDVLFKELFYLLIFTNSHNKFFPHVPETFLKLSVPAEVAAAQIQIDKPVFEIAYNFTRDQLIATLEQIAKPNVMIRLGTQRKAIGIMYNNNAYNVYHSDNPSPLEYRSVAGCVDLIMRVIQNKINNTDQSKEQEARVALFITANHLVGIPIDPMPNPREFLQKLLSDDIRKQAKQLGI